MYMRRHRYVNFREDGRLGLSFNGPVRGPATVTHVAWDSVAAAVADLQVGMVLCEVRRRGRLIMGSVLIRSG
jgi:hypothetical protein